MSEEEAKEELTAKAPEETPAEEKKPDRGTDLVDFKTASPEEIEARFKRIYHNMKEHEGRADEAIRVGKKMTERIVALERTQDTSINNAEIGEVKTALIKAKEDGDIPSEVELTAKLTQLASMKPKDVPADEPAEEPGISQHDLSVMRAWASETDEDGELVRPYAQETSPQLKHVAALGQSITTDPMFAGASMEEILAEVDRKMVKRRATGVIDPADNRGRKKPSKVQLNAAELAISAKMGVSPEDYAKYKD